MLKLIKNSLFCYDVGKEFLLEKELLELLELLKNQELISDYDIALAFVELNGNNLKLFSEELKSNKEIVLTALKNFDTIYDINCEDIGENLRDDEEVAIELIYKNIDNYNFISDRLKKIFAPAVLDSKLNSKHKNFKM